MLFSSYVLCLVLAFLLVCMGIQLFREVTLSALKPNIIFIVADDLGWNDVGWHNHEMHTPNMNKLASEGIILNHSYMQYMCTPCFTQYMPMGIRDLHKDHRLDSFYKRGLCEAVGWVYTISRSAFMTGYYPFRSGLQHGVIWRFSAGGLPLQFPLLPQKLKELGYDAHIVGKWHLGHCHLNYTPTYRGFDSFLGLYTGLSDYYTHSLPGEPTAHDFHNGTEKLTSFDNIHSSIPFRQQVEQILSSHSHSKPLFLYLPFHLPHSPLQKVSEEYLSHYQNVANENRRIYSGMVSALDDDIGRVLELLRQYKFYDNSIIVFTSDNGGELYFGGNNFPLRGNKNTMFEGGSRAVGFIHSALLPKSGFIYDGLIHAVDWFATFLSLAGGKPDVDIDGMDVWNNIVNNEPSPRTEFVYNIDNWNFTSPALNGAIRVGDWKLIFGKTGLPDGWFTPENFTNELNVIVNEDFLRDWPNSPYFLLFNIKDDPYERNNLADAMPAKVEELRQRVNEYTNKLVYPVWGPNDARGLESVKDGFLKPDYCEPIQQVTPVHTRVEI